MLNRQHTLSRAYSFEGKGLHTGTYAHMTLLPAPPDTGIRFKRTDLWDEPIIEAVAENVTNTARSTTISQDEVVVVTIEHLMSALTGLGVDNALIEIDNIEVPILDGSARQYAEAISADGLEEQDALRTFIEITEPIEIRDTKKGSWIRIEPSEIPSLEVTVDFHSNVLGVQTAKWDKDTDYVRDISVCRTFVFFHEIEFLYKNNLIKGGDVDNAIVIVEHPVTEAQLRELTGLMGRPLLSVTDSGYLNNLELHFPNECGRHKLLDLIGDLRLVGGCLVKAKITAYKPGHTINTTAAKAIRKAINSKLK